MIRFILGKDVSSLLNQSNIFCSEKQRRVRLLRVPYEILFSCFHLNLVAKFKEEMIIILNSEGSKRLKNQGTL